MVQWLVVILAHKIHKWVRLVIPFLLQHYA